MKTYRVLRTCTGFQRKFWEEGTVVDLPDDSNPPRHFQLVKKKVEVVKDAKKPTASLSSLQKQQGDLATPKTGFAGNIKTIETNIKAKVERSKAKKKR